MITHVPAVDKTCLDDMQIHDQRKVLVWGTFGNVYHVEGRWKEAEELFVQAMETRKRVLGQEHPDILTSMANLAFTWKSQGRNLEAILLLKECFQLQTHKLGPQHPDTESSLETLNKWQMESLTVES